MNVSDVIKIIQRMFNCTIERRLVSHSGVGGDRAKGKASSPTKDRNETGSGTGNGTSDQNEMTYHVSYHSSIYGSASNGVVWWSYLPSGHIKYLQENLELIAFRNSVTSIDMFDFILFTWGTVEKYYMELHSTLALAFGFIHKIFANLGDSYAGTTPGIRFPSSSRRY